MIKKLLLFFALLYGINLSNAQTTLAQGDLAIIGIDTQNKDFSFVTFVDLEGGTIIYFSDKPADNDYTLDQGAEGHLSYTVPAEGLVAGEVVRYKDNLSDFAPAGGGTFGIGGFTNSNDNITAYQGPSAGNVDTYLHAVGKSDAYIGIIPGGFTYKVLTIFDDGQYANVRSGETASAYFALINNISNWTTGSTGAGTLNTTPFALTISPGVSVSASNLYDFFYFENNGPSIEQSFLVEGENLIDDISLVVPDYYEISLTSGNGFGSSVTLSPTDGEVSSTMIYVRLMSGLAEGGYNSIITITSSGTSTKTVNLYGDIAPRPPLTLQTIWSGPLSTGLPNGIEVYVLEDIADLSIFGLGSTNDGTGYFGQEFTFPAVSANAGDFITITDDAEYFQEFFGFSADYVSTVANISGNDAVELLAFGDVIDSYGNVGINGAGTFWDYDDGWASRIKGTGPDGQTFNPRNWTISGTGVLTGAAINAEARQPVPLGGFLINWVGLIDSNWNEPRNWSPGRVPTVTDNVYINVSSNQPIINGDRSVNDLFLYDKLTINSGSLTTAGDVDGTLGGFIRVESGASLLTYGSISGDNHMVIRNTTFATNVGRYSVLGSPIDNANTSVLGKLVYAYDETIDYNLNEGDDRFYKVVDVPMPVGEGFFSAYTGTVTFQGTPNTGTYNIPLVNNREQDGINAGFNLVSNPYPAAIDVVEMFFENFSVISSQIYIWDDDNAPGTRGTNDDYITYNSLGTVGDNGKTFNGYIGTAQGFFVKANYSGSTVRDLVFNNDMKVKGFNSDQNFFRTREKAVTQRRMIAGNVDDAVRIKLNIKNSSNGKSNETLLGFIEDGTYGIDQVYDAYKLKGNSDLQFYSLIEEGHYAIQGLPSLSKEEERIPLGIDIGQSGRYEISVRDLTNFPEDKEIYIYDKDLRSYHKIGLNKAFKFDHDPVEALSRFEMVLTSNTTLSIDKVALDKTITIQGTFDKLIIRSQNGTTIKANSLRVTDILGRNILSMNNVEPFIEKEILHNFDMNSIYIVELNTSDGSLVKKIIIK